ncbi:general substrate transporter [Mucor ambiguus]|uniref:General substrate transporter n=1 Tax=Mucor ambiguus TaxID=91626 RepID=A0A0C9MVJ4_9FUNG|nr:general substrate transporter [Mucor ambiguus]
MHLARFLGIGGFMVAYDNGALAGCLLMDDFQQTFSFDSNSKSAIVLSVPLAASSIIAVLSGPIGDKVGRKRFVFIACIIHTIGTVTQCAGHTFAAFFIGKLIAGFSLGMFSVMCPLYQSEISLPEHRGRLISMHQFGVTIGFCLAFWITYGTFGMRNKLSWSIPLGIQIAPPIVLMLGLYFIPESPRWLIYQGRFSEAKQILRVLRAKNDDNDVELRMEYTGIIQERNYDRKYSSQSYKSLIDKGIDNNRKRTILGVGLHIMTQLTGINAILFYLPYILESTGVNESNSALLGNGISGMINMLATIPSFLYIDRWGRRRIMIIGGIAMATCMIIIAAVQGAYSIQLPASSVHVFPGTVFPITVYMDDSRASFCVLVFLCLFLACFALSWGSMGWIYPAEIYPQSIRAKGLGVTTGASYATSIFVSQIAHVSLEEIHLIFSGALIDQSPGAHHPQTAFEALSHLKQFNVDNGIDLSKASLHDDLSTTVASSSSTVNQLIYHHQQSHQQHQMDATLDADPSSRPQHVEQIELKPLN